MQDSTVIKAVEEPETCKETLRAQRGNGSWMRKEMKPEMKKVAIIWSSPNKDGLTASAKNEIMRGLIDAAHNHFLAQKRCILAACAGGTGRGTQECLQQMERGLVHMGMRTYDRISVVRYNKDYILPAMYEAGRTYADRLETGFDMYY